MQRQRSESAHGLLQPAPPGNVTVMDMGRSEGMAWVSILILHDGLFDQDELGQIKNNMSGIDQSGGGGLSTLDV